MKIQLKAICLNHFIVVVIISVLILSCNSRKRIERITWVNVIYKNNTMFDISIKAYRYGNVKLYLIKQNDSLVQRYSLPTGGIGDVLYGYKSIQIISNNKKKRIYKDSIYKNSLFDLENYYFYKKDKEYFRTYTFLE